MRGAVLSIFLLIFTAFAKAQSTQTHDFSFTIISLTTNEPLKDVTVVLKKNSATSISSINGVATFNSLESGDYKATVTLEGYKTQTITFKVPDMAGISVFLENEEQESLGEIVIQSTRSTRSFSRTPTRIEFIGGEELVEKTAMNSTNIAMVLRESTGIQMQQTSQSSANQSIRIQGLDGRYTQLLKDGFPLYGGFAGGLSIMQIPPLDIAQFEIIKGSASTLYGGGAIAGLVNMQSKLPDDEPVLDLMTVGTQAQGYTGNIFYSARNEKWGTTLYASGNSQRAYDPDNNGYSNLPDAKTISINPKVFYYPSDKTTLWLGLNGTYDNRAGGELTAINNNGTGYKETNESQRLSTQAVWETKLTDDSALQFKNSIALFDRTLLTPGFRFEGKQVNTFTEATYKTSTAKTDWVLGANLYSSDFEELGAINARDQKDTTVGAFVNNVTDLSTNWILETGFRTDYAADWGVFALPRFSLLYKDAGSFTSRFGGGLGYKIPDLFTEDAERLNFQNVLAIDKDALKAETSYGVNLDFNYSTQLTDELRFSVNQLFYVTAIRNGLLLNTTDGNTFSYENASKSTLSRGAETNLKFSYHDFKWFLNYAFIDTQLNFLDGNPQKPLTAKHNAGSVIMYETEQWRLGFETYYTGNQLLSNGSTATDFVTMGLLAMRNFEWGHLFLNFENLTNRRQDRFTPTVSVTNGTPTFSEIYAPNDGFILSAGIIFKVFGNHDEHHDD
jgi:iron complex outermembrane receptor protein